MTLRVVTGGAGTGKTTRLLVLMEEWLAEHPLSEGQRVLALTFMHGSRIRLSERLQASAALGRFACVTIDGFAREICSRWQTRLASRGVSLPSDDDPRVYDATCSAAAELLDDRLVARWVAATYPLIVVDEFQDCRGSRPMIVERLAAEADVLVAADPFQDLNDTGENPAVAMLMRNGLTSEVLTRVHRTRVPALLAGAAALRDGKRLVSGAGLTIEGAPSQHLAASKLCSFIANLKGASAAVISAGRPTQNSFPRQVLDAAATTKGYGRQKNLGPYSVSWEASPDTHREGLLSALALGEGATRTAGEIRAALPLGNPLARLIAEWLEHERRLRGRTEFPVADVRREVARAEGAHRSMPRHGGRLRALTIHQAKNREFERVIVLWGFGVPGDAEMQRRWLYNAITRAKAAAFVVVQDPGGKRLKAPPFEASGDDRGH